MAERKASQLALHANAPAASYEDLFQLRGAPYDSAMSRYPEARREEFLNTIARANLEAGALVADVPAGGGYLAKYLPQGCVWLGHEPCASFGHGATELDRDLLPLPWPDASVDAALSIAGVHHLDDKLPLFAELARVVKQGGRLVLADVHEASAVSRFLDGWVDRHNSTGHEGNYLGGHTPGELRQAGWDVLSAERVPFHWRFASLADMGEFAHSLFDLRTSSPADTARTIGAELGVDTMADGVGMRWELYMVVATPLASRA
ncbi:class I SAM-dependent methyltransferase [Emcibacter sp. SYSU 3D8]|uniref:class I SAM-dependent methyltransferase n=1 Tax=Emcibacter sp. SYSU 3D8 TaxID=3133969 RepID=UPI0031FF2FFE